MRRYCPFQMCPAEGSRYLSMVNYKAFSLVLTRKCKAADCFDAYASSNKQSNQSMGTELIWNPCNTYNNVYCISLCVGMTDFKSVVLWF